MDPKVLSETEQTTPLPTCATIVIGILLILLVVIGILIIAYY